MNSYNDKQNNDEQIYQEVILDLFKNPLNKKVIKNFDIRENGLNPLCGDEIEVRLKFDKKNKIKDVGFQGAGCVVSQVAASLLTDFIKGKSKEDVLAITEDQMIKFLNIPISHTRLKCALLCLKTLQKGLKK